MSGKHLKTKVLVEALLFSSPRALSLEKISEIVGCSLEETEGALQELCLELNQREGAIVVRKVAGKWQMVVRPEIGSFLKQKLQVVSQGKLSRAALEVLAIIALHQPVSKGEIDLKRGVDSGSVLRSLLERGLVSVVTEDAGKKFPLKYQVTDKFYEVFGLESEETWRKICANFLGEEDGGAFKQISG